MIRASDNLNQPKVVFRYTTLIKTSEELCQPAIKRNFDPYRYLFIAHAAE